MLSLRSRILLRSSAALTSSGVPWLLAEHANAEGHPTTPQLFKVGVSNRFFDTVGDSSVPLAHRLARCAAGARPGVDSFKQRNFTAMSRVPRGTGLRCAAAH